MAPRKIIATIAATLYALAVTVCIAVVTGSPYAYMVGEVDDGKRVTVCDLPVAPDDMRDVTMPMTGVLVLGLLVVGVVRSARSRRVTPILVYGGLVAAFWGWRFYLQSRGC